MKSWNRSSRTMRLFAVTRDDQCRTAVAFYDPSRGNSDHAAMPAVSLYHHAERLAQRGVTRQSFINLLHNAPLFFLALAVEFVEPGGNVSCHCRVFGT